MRKWHVLAVLAALVLSACLGSASRGVQDQKKTHGECSACHMFSEETGRTELQGNATPDQLCTGCHSDRVKAGEHRVGVPVSAGTTSLPLVEGKVACITCHEPHGLSGKASLLRTEPGDLCNRCHLK